MDLLFYELIQSTTITTTCHILFDFVVNILYELMFLIFEGMLFHIIAPLKPMEYLTQFVLLNSKCMFDADRVL